MQSFRVNAELLTLGFKALKQLPQTEINVQYYNCIIYHCYKPLFKQHIILSLREMLISRSSPYVINNSVILTAVGVQSGRSITIAHIQLLHSTTIHYALPPCPYTSSCHSDLGTRA
jgi:hypothetical protein